MRILRLLTTIVILGAAPALAAAAGCGAAMPAPAERTAVPGRGIDRDLLDAAFRAEVNRHRCARGLPALAPAAPMARQAQTHSRWMAEAGKLSHTSTVRGRRKLMDRLRASGLRFRTGTENIGMVPRYRIDGGRFRVLDAGACRFATAAGKALPPHSYASLARHVVAMWMNSPGHRRNVLDPQVRRVATAAAPQPAPHCGRVWLTQNFIG